MNKRIRKRKINERRRKEEIAKFLDLQRKLDDENRKKEKEKRRLIQEEKNRIESSSKNTKDSVEDVTGRAFYKK